jgi:hypothetical protein
MVWGIDRSPKPHIKSLLNSNQQKKLTKLEANHTFSLPFFHQFNQNRLEPYQKHSSLYTSSCQGSFKQTTQKDQRSFLFVCVCAGIPPRFFGVFEGEKKRGRQINKVKGDDDWFCLF